MSLSTFNTRNAPISTHTHMSNAIRRRLATTNNSTSIRPNTTQAISRHNPTQSTSIIKHTRQTYKPPKPVSRPQTTARHASTRPPPKPVSRPKTSVSKNTPNRSFASNVSSNLRPVSRQRPKSSPFASDVPRIMPLEKLKVVPKRRVIKKIKVASKPAPISHKKPTLIVESRVEYFDHFPLPSSVSPSPPTLPLFPIVSPPFNPLDIFPGRRKEIIQFFELNCAEIRLFSTSVNGYLDFLHRSMIFSTPNVNEDEDEDLLVALNAWQLISDYLLPQAKVKLDAVPSHIASDILQTYTDSTTCSFTFSDSIPPRPPPDLFYSTHTFIFSYLIDVLQLSKTEFIDKMNGFIF